MEICRWSRQLKANAFMDFTWEVMDRIIRGDVTYTPSTQQLINPQVQSLIIQQNNTQQQIAALTTLITSTLPRPYKPLYTRWMGNIYAKIDKIASSLDLSRKQMFHKLYKELQDTYDIDLNEYQYEYCYTHNLEDTGLYTMNTIESDQQLKQMFQIMVDNSIEQPENTQEIFAQTHAS